MHQHKDLSRRLDKLETLLAPKTPDSMARVRRFNAWLSEHREALAELRQLSSTVDLTAWVGHESGTGELGNTAEERAAFARWNERLNYYWHVAGMEDESE